MLWIAELMIDGSVAAFSSRNSQKQTRIRQQRYRSQSTSMRIIMSKCLKPDNKSSMHKLVANAISSERKTTQES